MNRLARNAGMLEEDRVLELDGHSFTFYDEYIDLIRSHRDSILNVESAYVEVIPFLSLIALGSGKVIGAYPKVINDFEYAVKEYSFFVSIPAGINMGFDWIKSYLKQFKLFKNPEAFRSVGGIHFYREHIPQRVGLGGLSGN